MMGRKTPNYVWVFLGMIVFFIAITRYPAIIGLNSDIGLILSQMWPTLFLVCVAVYMFSKANKAGRFGGMLFLGLAFCLFLNSANTQSLITTEMSMGLTLQELQIWTMIISIFMGAIVFSKR